jgi:hypothetical protein
MVLSYVVIGAALSPTIYPTRLILTLLAYFLGLGLSAHALNEIHARHWGTALGKGELEMLFIVPLIGGLAVGAYGVAVLREVSGGPLAPVVLSVFIGLETFFLVGYNTNILGGRLHATTSFAFSWAALPVLISYYVNALTLTPAVILMALTMATTAGIEINLSRWCKDFRRGSSVVEIRFADNTNRRTSTAELIANPERSLKLIVATVDILGVALITYRLLG